MGRMDSQSENTANKMSQKHGVHKVLARSYSVYFVLLLAGVCLDLIFGFKIFSDSFMVPVGFFFLIIASMIIIWAQKAGHAFKKVSEKKTEHFHFGPYRYTRIPTHLGLFLLILSFGFIANSFFVILATIISFLFSKFIFVKKYEKILEEKYGEAYKEYKKLVKF